MKCSSCRTEGQPGERFCSKCGQDLYPPRSDVKSARTSSSQEDANRSPGLSTRAGMPGWAVALAVFIFFLAGGYIVLVAKGVVTFSGAVPVQPAQTAPALPAADTHLRIYQSGDEWTYAESFTVTDANGQTVTATGLETDRILWETVQGQPVLTDLVTDQAALANGRQISYSVENYFQQNSAGDCYTLGSHILGANRNAATLSEPFLVYHGDWTSFEAGPHEDSTTDWNGDEVEIKVELGPGNRAMPNGKVTYCWNFNMHWNFNAGQEEPDGRPRDLSGMFSPSLGKFVHATYSTSVPGVGNVVGTMNLIDYRLMPNKK